MSVAAPAFGAAGTSTGVTSAATANVPVPTGVAANDAILVFLYRAGTGLAAVTTMPAGFFLLDTVEATGTGAHTMDVLVKRASAADTGTYNFAWSGAATREGVAVRFTGAATTIDYLAGVATNGSTSSSTTTPAVAATSTATGRTLIHVSTQSTAGASAPPSGFTEVVDNSARVAVSYKRYTGALVDTGNLSATSTSSAHTAFLIGIRPEPIDPIIDAGADVVLRAGDTLTRSGIVVDDGAQEVVFFGWEVVSGPPGATTGIISTDQTLSWSPAVPGTYSVYLGGSHEGPHVGYDDFTVQVSPATAFLEQSLAGGQVWVEAAWGADLADDPDTWEWSDITEDVRISDGQAIEISIGRADEAGETQPASCNVVLDNSLGAYGLGGQSPNWPYVRRNTPIRVRVFCEDLDGPVSRFEGYAVSWQPEWDVTGRNATVALTAAGELRRLVQNKGPGSSPYRRAILNTADTAGIVAYWPCEESGAVTGGFSPAIGSYPLRWSTDWRTPVPGEVGGWVASDPIALVEKAELYGAVPTYTATGAAQIRFLMAFPSSGIPVDQPLLLVSVSGSTNWWILRYADGGGLNVRVLSSSGSERENASYPFDVDGRLLIVDLALEEVGGNVEYALATLENSSNFGRGVTGTVSGSLGRVESVLVNTYTDWADDGIDPAEVTLPAEASIGVGHLFVADTITSVFTNLIEFSGYNGELPYDRITRFADESGIRAAGYDVQNPPLQNTDILGPQLSGDVLGILREAEQCDKGLLFDGLEFGLSYWTRRALQSRPVDLSIGAPLLLPDFTPIDDDQGQTNQVTLQVRDGGAVVVEDTDGPLGVAAIGEYASQVTLNLGTDEAAEQHAAWHVRHGTVEGYRYPTLRFSLAEFPQLVAGWLAMPLGARIDIVDLDQARPQEAASTVSLRMLGYTETLSQDRWEVAANVAPYGPWRIVEVGEDGVDVGDDGEFVPHLDTLGSELAAPMEVGASFISVATTAGPIWSTAATNYPLTLDVGGIPVTVTGCAGGSSPQTFTIDDGLYVADYEDEYAPPYVPGAPGPTTAKAAGAPVKVWQPPRLAL